MPYANVPDEMQDKMESCVTQLTEKGQDKQAAIAICYTSVVEGKALDLAIEDYHLAIKTGARNRSDDKERIRTIRKAARQIDGLTLEMEPKDDDETTMDKIIGKAGNLTIEGGDPIFYTVVKAAGDWELDVLGVPYGGPNGGKDADGEYFSAETKTYEDQFPNPPAVYYHGFSPDGKPMGEPAIIGKVQRIWKDAKGWWYRVILDKANDLSKRIWASAQQGKARASSGSIAHMVRKTRDGHITHWPVVELSLIDADGKRQPANQYAVAMLAAKAHYEQSGNIFPVIPGADDSAGNDGKSEPVSNSKNILGGMTMTPEEIKAMTEAIKAEMKAEQDAAKAEQDKIDVAVKAEREKWEAEAAKARRLPTSDAPAVLKYDRAYDNMDAADTAFMVDLLRANQKRGGAAPSDQALKSLAAKLEEDKSTVGEHGRWEMKSAGMKANEVDYSTLANYGDEWVGIAYSTALWESIRQATVVVNKLPSIEVPRGMESIYLPLESTDPVFYKVAENTTYDSTMKYPAPTITSSQMGTARVQLTLSKLGARVLYSGELEERSLIPFVSQLRQQLQKAGAEYLESAVIDGDTETSTGTNINFMTSTTAQSAQHWMVFNGFRKSPLVTTSANSRSAAGSLDVTDYLETVKLMGASALNALDMSKVSYIVDPWTAYKTAALPEVLTRDVYSMPTVEGGRVRELFGYEVITSGSICKQSTKRLSLATGKIDDQTETNNLYGSILAVRWDQWKFGWQRRATIETFRWPGADTNEIYMQMVCGLIQRDTEASAITYYVGV